MWCEDCQWDSVEDLENTANICSYNSITEELSEGATHVHYLSHVLRKLVIVLRGNTLMLCDNIELV
jgi:hypothetical protein